MSLKQQAASLVWTFLILLPALAQPNASSEAAQRTGQQEQQREAIEQKGLLLAGELIEDSKSLRLPENRALVQSAVADLLWSRDAKAARALFKEAASNLQQFKNSLDDDRQQGDALQENYAELRRVLLRVLVIHEPRSARNFLLNTNLALQPEDEFNLTLDLAAQLTISDPQQSLRIAQESLNSRVSYQLVDVVTKLQGKDEKAAVQLVSSIVTKLRSENLNLNGDAANVAGELLRLGVQSQSQEAGRATGCALAPSPIDPADYSELIRMVAAAALRPPGDPDLLLTLQSVMPEVERDVPSLAPQLKRKLAQLPKTPNQPEESAQGQEEASSPLSPVESRGRVSLEDQALELAAQAAVAVKKGELKHARELLDEASGLLANRAKNYRQLAAQLQIAKAYAACDPQRSFEMMEPLVDQLNRLADAIGVVDGFISKGSYARDDELLLKPLAESVKSLLSENSGPLALLARADFDRAKALANRFQRPEVRTLASLFIAQSVLSTPAPPEDQAYLAVQH